ncbi:MAG TPA: HEAT repeat domain-containing protein [Planctomycetota bacterium]
MFRASPLFAFLLLAAVLPAHGGQYRGQGTPVAPTPGGGVPTPGGPSGPSSPGSSGPTTGGRPSAPETTSWQTWWEFNKEPFLLLRKVEDKTPTTGSDDFYLGLRRTEARRDTLKPTTSDLQDRVVPTLGKLLRAESNRDIQSACLVALGKIGRDGPGLELEKTMVPLIARDDQEVRETAVLALGIAGREQALPILAALLRGDADGKRLSDRAEVSDRTRAFAAYGLGLLAMRSEDGALKSQVHDLLWPLLQDKQLKNRELLTAAVTALGLLRDPERAPHKRLAWQTVEELLTWYQIDLGRSDEIVQAHAPVAIARLLGRGSSPLHQRCKEHFAAVLNASQRRSNPILQSAALALGMLGLPAEENPDDAACAKALQLHYDRGHDRQARYFSLMALGRIGGTANRTWLLSAYERSSKGVERPWVGLALGLIADAALRRGELDAEVAEMLLVDIQTIRNDDVRAALAVAIGLCGHLSAVPTVTRLLHEQEGNERLGGYLCVSLALLGDTTTAPALTAILERSVRRPFLLQQAAVALGRLGDKNATPRLLEMLQRSESVAVLSALAIAIGEIGDRRSIDPLITLAGDAEQTKLGRAFVAAALGGVGDKDVMPWNVPLSKDCNYAAVVDTLTNGATGVLDIL